MGHKGVSAHHAWSKLLISLTIIILVGIVLIFVALFIWSYLQEKKPANTTFHEGAYPAEPLSGDYKGTFSRDTSWQGKRFNDDGTGINNFEDGQRYKFVTSQTKSLGGDQEVMRIDYNQGENPWWLRFIVDELVEVEQTKYQGKVYLRIGPVHFTLAYFELEAQPPQVVL